jgi:hypothetical protein
MTTAATTKREVQTPLNLSLNGKPNGWVMARVTWDDTDGEVSNVEVEIATKVDPSTNKPLEYERAPKWLHACLMAGGLHQFCYEKSRS